MADDQAKDEEPVTVKWRHADMLLSHALLLHGMEGVTAGRRLLLDASTLEHLHTLDTCFKSEGPGGDDRRYIALARKANPAGLCVGRVKFAPEKWRWCAIDTETFRYVLGCSQIQAAALQLSQLITGGVRTVSNRPAYPLPFLRSAAGERSVQPRWLVRKQEAAAAAVGAPELRGPGRVETVGKVGSVLSPDAAAHGGAGHTLSADERRASAAARAALDSEDPVERRAAPAESTHGRAARSPSADERRARAAARATSAVAGAHVSGDRALSAAVQPRAVESASEGGARAIGTDALATGPRLAAVRRRRAQATAIEGEEPSGGPATAAAALATNAASGDRGICASSSGALPEGDPGAGGAGVSTVTRLLQRVPALIELPGAAVAVCPAPCDDAAVTKLARDARVSERYAQDVMAGVGVGSVALLSPRRALIAVAGVRLEGGAAARLELLLPPPREPETRARALLLAVASALGGHGAVRLRVEAAPEQEELYRALGFRHGELALTAPALEALRGKLGLRKARETRGAKRCRLGE